MTPPHDMDSRSKSALASILDAPLLLSLLGGSIFVLVFHFAYAGINDSFYQARDDGVITMSHARNLVDYGFIGVNPSGGRVEGYSAPVQFFLFAAAYALTGTGYAAYAAAQTVATTFLLGALFILFFQERKIAAVVLTSLGALFLAYLRPFLEWHGSGMENAVTHVLFPAAVLILVSLVRMERIVYPLAIPVFLASISRIESIYHIGPLLAIFGLFWLLAFRDRGGLRWGGLRFSGVVLGLWTLFQLWRYLYFGDLLPNTAYAQSISVFDNLRSWPRPGEGHMGRARDILTFHGGVVLLQALAAALALARRRSTVLLVLLIGSLTLTAAFSELVFGIARLDRPRLTTHLAVFAALGAATLLYCFGKSRRALWAALGTAAATVFAMNVTNPSHLCCSAEGVEILGEEFARVAETEALPRLTVSNPDLGGVSWRKQFNVVDLGRLGSPIMAKTLGPLRADYFFHYAAPDIIESYNSWSCQYDGEIFSDPRFAQLYRPLEVSVHDWTKESCASNPESQSGLWIRSDILQSSNSAERRLIDRLAANPSVGPLREELENCQAAGGIYNCAYVARTAYRFLPEFREQGQADELDEIFAVSRTAAFDRYLINGHRDGQAHTDAVELIFDNMEISAIGGSRPIISSDHDVYLNENKLIYLKEPCSREDIDPQFFLHLVPADANDLSDDRKQYGFDNLDLSFNQDTISWWRGKCMAIIALPEYSIAEIRTGQYIKDQGPIWQGSYRFSEPTE